MPATAISTSGLGSIGRRTAGTSRRKPDPKAKWSSDNPVPPIGAKIKPKINGPWQGVVTGYFVEHGYQGIEVDCTGHKRPAYYEKQGGDPKRVLFFGVDLTAVEAT